MRKESLILVRGKRSQDDMAELLGVHKNTYARWERGEREISADALVKLSQEGWSPAWILTGEGPARLDEAVPETAQVMKNAAESALDAVSREQGDAFNEVMFHVASAYVDEASGEWADQLAPGRAQLVAAVYDILAANKPATAAQLIRLIRNALALRSQ